MQASAGLASSRRCPSQSHWRETLLLVVASGVILLIMTRPAFSAFFFGEDFIYLGQYRAHGDSFWRAVLSPTDNIFFRPVFCAVNLLWQFVLPLDPLVHHIRNFAFTIVNLALFYRVLLRWVVSLWARVVALLVFVFSKIHLTTIGYINVYDSIISLMLLLLTVLFFSRYADGRRVLDYVLAMLFCLLSIFTKDYGLVVVCVVFALVISISLSSGKWQFSFRLWLARLAPLPLMVVLYLGLRYAIVGPLPSAALAESTQIPAQVAARKVEVYAPQVSLPVAIRKVVVFTSTIGNFSFTDKGTTGADGLSALFQSVADERGIDLPAYGLQSNWIDFLLYTLFLVLLIGTIRVGIPSRWLLLFPLVWIISYFGPTLLTRNLQMYYMYEPLVGAALLVAICLDRASRRLLISWGLMLLVVVVNGFVSNYNSLYHWQYVANAAEKIQKPLVEAYRDKYIESVTFVTAPSTRPFWQYTLAADLKGPMIPELMAMPSLEVRFIDYRDVSSTQLRVDERNLVFEPDNGFVLYDPEKPGPPLLLRAISPSVTHVGTSFNAQPGGLSALSIDAENATPGTVVIMGDRQLATTYGNNRWLTALVPVELVTEPARYVVYLTDGITESNRLEFVVTDGDTASASAAPSAATPTSGVAQRPLVLHKLNPNRTQVGKVFNAQPNGQAALSVECENATPGTVIIFGDVPLATSYGSERWVTAIVPPELYSHPGRYEVYLRSGDRESNRVEFVVEP